MSAPPARAGERGVALITVLLAIAVLTAIVSRLSLSNQVWIRQVEGGTAQAQAGQAARAVEYWVAGILGRDDNEFDGHTDPWARPLPPMPVGWGEVSGRVEDLQGRFNLHNLVTAEGETNPPAVARFRRLLQALELPPGIADAAADWADADSRPTGGWGAEDGFYGGRNPPYLAANRPFGDAAELRLVRRVTADVWQKLRPHVVALPGPTGVNLNTATAPVLAAYIEQWGPPRVAMNQAEQWVKRTDRQPFADKASFASEALGGKDASVPPELTVTTEYFMAHTRFRFGDVDYGLATLYHRGGGEVTIVRHRREIR